MHSLSGDLSRYFCGKYHSFYYYISKQTWNILRAYVLRATQHQTLQPVQSFYLAVSQNAWIFYIHSLILKCLFLFSTNSNDYIDMHFIEDFCIANILFFITPHFSSASTSMQNCYFLLQWWLDISAWNPNVFLVVYTKKKHIVYSISL